MYEFLDRLVAVALPRVRDFRGVNDKGFDGRGNYTVALPNRSSFLRSTSIKSPGLTVWISLLSLQHGTDREALALLKEFEYHFKTR